MSRGSRETCYKAVQSQQLIARMVVGVQDKALSATQKNAYLNSQTTLAKTNARTSSQLNVGRSRSHAFEN